MQPALRVFVRLQSAPDYLINFVNFVTGTKFIRACHKIYSECWKFMETHGKLVECFC
jgi:hypothetical protein